MIGEPIEAGKVKRVRVRTFAAADGLAKVVPESTEEAQYSLLWPPVCVLARGRFGVNEVLGPFSDPELAAMFDRIEVDVDPQLTAAFPQRRLTAVEIELADGRRLQAGPLEAPGEPDDPELPALVAAKVSRLMGNPATAPRASGSSGLRDQDAEQLVALMCRLARRQRQPRRPASGSGASSRRRAGDGRCLSWSSEGSHLPTGRAVPAQWQACLDYDSGPLLGRIVAPIHAVAFSEDVQTPPQRVREVAELARDGHYHLLAGLGHGSAFGHRPAVVNECLRCIIDRESRTLKAPA